MRPLKIDEVTRAILLAPDAVVLTSRDPDRQRNRPSAMITRCLADIEAKPVGWLWPGRIARGKVSIVAGNPGLGKSQVTASLAAVVTTGGIWPVDRCACETGSVLFLNAEDDAADTLKPRLVAAGADTRRVHVIDAVISSYTGNGEQGRRSFSLESDLEALSQELRNRADVALVVIDPITAYLGSTDSHKNADIRALLAPLGDLAARHEVAIVGVSHLNKGSNTQALMRVSGSLAFVAAARAAWLVAEDPHDKARRLFLPMKNNLGPDASGLSFRIEGTTISSEVGDLATSRVTWDAEPATESANDVLAQAGSPAETSALEDAGDWLQGALENGPRPSRELRREAEEAGLSWATVRRAKQRVKVQCTKSAMNGPWVWSLPKMLNGDEDAQEGNVSTFGKLEHLLRLEPEVIDLA